MYKPVRISPTVIICPAFHRQMTQIYTLQSWPPFLAHSLQKMVPVPFLKDNMDHSLKNSVIPTNYRSQPKVLCLVSQSIWAAITKYYQLCSLIQLTLEQGRK